MPKIAIESDAGPTGVPAKGKLRRRPPMWRPGQPIPEYTTYQDFAAIVQAEVGWASFTDRSAESYPGLPVVQVEGISANFVVTKPGLNMIRARFEAAKPFPQRGRRGSQTDTPIAA